MYFKGERVKQIDRSLIKNVISTDEQKVENLDYL